MANEVGTASNLEDLFGKIVSFLTTNATLVAANQDWQALRLRRDNIATHTSNLPDPTSANARKMIHTFRYDPRSLNMNNPAQNGQESFYVTNSGYTAGTSYNQWILKASREVKTVRIKAPVGFSYASYAPKSFRLQYSDDGTAWTTALTVSNAPNWFVGERRDFAVPGTPGAHLYWKIIWDATQAVSYIGWTELMLLEADGTVANHFGSEVILKARGNAGTDAIYTGIRSEYDSAAGWYNLFLNGYTGYDPNVDSWFEQPGALPGYTVGSTLLKPNPMVPCWNTTMPYWFAASGRSFRFGVKVSTSYEGGYLGFILPYATPGQYPYPLAVGGSLVPQDGARSAEWRYSYVSFRHGVYPGPGTNNYPDNDSTKHATLYIRNPDGEWAYVGNRTAYSSTDTEGISGPYFSGPPYVPAQYQGYRTVWPHCMFGSSQLSRGRRPWRECLGGGYMLLPCIINQVGPTWLVYGELEGTFWISGYQNSPENTTTFGGKTHIILQNAYRNTAHEFWALSLD